MGGVPQSGGTQSGVPPDGVLHVWRIGVDATPQAQAALSGLLDRAESDRSAGYGPARLRRRFTVVHGAVRVILAGYLGVRPGRLRIAAGPWGKPSLADPAAGIEFSLSYAPGFALLAVSGGRAVGIDVAHVRPGFPATAFASRYFPATERDQVHAAGPADGQVWSRLWARKEAWVKAAGVRIALGLRLPVAEPGRSLCVRDPAGRVPGAWLLRDLPAPAGHAICAAMAGTRPFRVILRAWSQHDAAVYARHLK